MLALAAKSDIVDKRITNTSTHTHKQGCRRTIEMTIEGVFSQPIVKTNSDPKFDMCHTVISYKLKLSGFQLSTFR